jgi:hypothetical protein
MGREVYRVNFIDFGITEIYKVRMDPYTFSSIVFEGKIGSIAIADFSSESKNNRLVAQNEIEICISVSTSL